MNDSAELVFVVGARPNFMKAAPILTALREQAPQVTWRLVHTGQHYDAEMKDEFFRQLGMPEPDFDLNVGSGSHAYQTAEIMKRFEPVLDQTIPRAVVVVGDVNSTIACALVAIKKGIGVVHIEAGLRSNDRTMPEEINRILTDQLSDLLFTTERSAADNLIREGLGDRHIEFVGNVMIDSLKQHLRRATPAGVTIGRFADSELYGKDGFALLTLHRPATVDHPAVLERVIGVLAQLSERLPIVFPVHPRTRKRLEETGLLSRLEGPRWCVLPPAPYLDMLGLMSGARLVLTDSGGIQEETTALGIPCITLRDNTERPITVEQGTNVVVGTDPGKISDAFLETMRTGGKAGRVPELWDGEAARRIAARLREWAEAQPH